MKLPEFSVTKRVTTTMMTLILVVIGFISLSRLGLDFFPDIDFPTVSVITAYKGASSEDIETSITKPLEQVISSVNRIKKVTSQTSEGASVIMVEFEWGTNLDFAAQDIRDQIGLYQNLLPPDASDPMVVKFNFSQFPIIFWGITADMPTAKLKKLIEDDVAPRLNRLDGVASSQVFSSDIREILVDVDKRALESRSLTLDQVVLALQSQNMNLPAGNIVERHTDLLVRTIGEYKSLDEIRATIVGSTPNGEPVYVRDIADVSDGLKETRYEARIQGKNGIFLMVNKQSGANTALIGKVVKKEMVKIGKIIPAGVVFNVIMDQSDMIEAVTKRTIENAWQGGILAIALIFIFLLNWRPTLIIGISIPLSVVTTFIAFYAAGYTLNLLTLGGLTLGIGMLVDNAIVVIENTFRRIEEEGDDPVKGSILGASEVGMAITASTLTTIVVFLPMVFATGITAKFTRALALAITFSLISSLFVALTVVPLLSSFLFKKKTGTRPAAAKAPNSFKKMLLTWQGFEKARAAYRRSLEKVLRRPKLAIGVVLAVFAASLALIPILGTEFMPTMDQDMIFLKVTMPVGTSLEETNRVLLLVEKKAKEDPDINVVTVQAGSQAEVNPSDMASGTGSTGSHEGILYIGLKKKDFRKRTADKITEDLRSVFPKIKNARFESIDMSSSFMGGAQTPVDIKLFGKEIDELKKRADIIVEKIKDVEGIRDVNHTLALAKPEYHIKIDRERTARLGLMLGQVGNTVQTATLGKVATRYRDADEEVDVRVRFKKVYRDDISEIRNIPLVTALKKTVYLDQLATIEPGQGPIRIDRENQSRRVSITGNVSGRDIGSVIKDVKKRLRKMERELPQGYFLEYGGSYEQMIDAFKVLLGAMLLATLLVYMVMASQFESLLDPFIIMFTIPMGLIGVILGMLVTGSPINLPVWIGFILLEGIAVNNGIVMIDYIHQLRKSGIETHTAILQGCATRLRPVLLTALTTILGMFPMAVSKSSGSEFRAPMALAVLTGLVTTTFLTLYIIPVIYAQFEKVKFGKAEPRS